LYTDTENFIWTSPIVEDTPDHSAQEAGRGSKECKVSDQRRQY
jgi:hypothetical protein